MAPRPLGPLVWFERVQELSGIELKSRPCLLSQHRALPTSVPYSCLLPWPSSPLSQTFVLLSPTVHQEFPECLSSLPSPLSFLHPVQRGTTHLQPSLLGSLTIHSPSQHPRHLPPAPWSSESMRRKLKPHLEVPGSRVHSKKGCWASRRSLGRWGPEA